MSDRDRLIELKRKAINYAQEKADERGGLVCIDDEVDYLLANGVTVPPCKVGDIVYAKVFDEIKSFVVASIELKYTAKNLENTCIAYNGEYPIIFEFENIGKTVFLTKEEAEKKLKGLKNDEM